MSLSAEARYAAGLLLGRPFQVLVQVTNRCNMRCSFCDFWPNGARPEEELSLDEHRRVAEELAGLGTFLVSLEGGEPFVRPDLVDLVRAYAGRHLPALFTNGWWVTPEGAKALFDAGLAHVGVSLDFPEARRHDGKRGPPGAFERALRAVEALRDAAPGGGKQVHIMTVLMESNWRDLDALLRLSADRGVGHAVTLLSTGGYRRGPKARAASAGAQVDRPPPPEAARHLLRLWRRHRHVRFFREYFQVMRRFLEGGPTGTCRAGVQTFNVDHVGNVSPCIERLDEVAGNVRKEPLAAIHARLVARSPALAGCNACWTACRGFAHVMGGGGSARAWADLAARMRSR